jgi:D-3-phosphoglycerate dehydrogenase
LTILVTAPALAAVGVSRLEAADCRVLYVRQGEADLERLMASEPVDAVISRTMSFGAREMAACPTLKVISKHGAGVDNIDVDEATRRGIPVLYSGGNSQAVAELTIGMAISIARDFAVHDRALHGDGWTRNQIGVELCGRKIGIVGQGKIGSKVAAIASALGMRVMVHDPNLRERGYQAIASLHELLRRSDVLSLHCPLNQTTRGMIGAAELALLPKGAIVLNTARGEIVDETALVAALRSGRLRGAGLDGFAVEPLPADHPYRSLPNVLLTPHVGGSTEEALAAVAIGAADNALLWLQHREIDPKLCVNPSVLDRTREVSDS